MIYKAPKSQKESGRIQKTLDTLTENSIMLQNCHNGLSK